MKMGGLLYVFGAVFVVPILIARFVLRGGWQAIGYAYAIWFGFLALQVLIGAPTGQVSEATGWMMILAIYLSIPVIVVLVLLMNLARGLKGLVDRYKRA